MKQSFRQWAVCTSIFLCAGMSVVVSPLVQILAVQYPDTPITSIRTITTLPSLVSFILSFFLAAQLGRRLSYRTAVILGSGLCLVGGLLPVFLNRSFAFILFSRFLFGMGFAMFSMRNAIATAVYGQKDASVWLGNGMFVMNIVAVLVQLVSGLLGDMNWRYSFLLHLLCLVPLLIGVFWFREPPKLLPVKEDKPDRRLRMPSWKAVVFALLTAASSICVFPIISSIALLVNDRGFGTAAQAGIVTASFTVGTGAPGIIFGKIYKKMGRWLMPAGSLFAIVGFLCILLSGSLSLVIIGSVLCGIAQSIVILCYSTWAMEVSTPENRAVSMTLIPSFISGGSFLSSYFITAAGVVGRYIPLFDTELEKAFLIGLFFYAVLGLVYLLRDGRPLKE